MINLFIIPQFVNDARIVCSSQRDFNSSGMRGTQQRLPTQRSNGASHRQGTKAARVVQLTFFLGILMLTAPVVGQSLEVPKSAEFIQIAVEGTMAVGLSCYVGDPTTKRLKFIAIDDKPAKRYKFNNYAHLWQYWSERDFTLFLDLGESRGPITSRLNYVLIRKSRSNTGG